MKRMRKLQSHVADESVESIQEGVRIVLDAGRGIKRAASMKIGIRPRRKAAGPSSMTLNPSIFQSSKAKQNSANVVQFQKGGFKQRCARRMTACSQVTAGSSWFSALTMLLTFYALFGDDMRLLFSTKPADIIFDCVTIAAMLIFGTEILVCSIGKAGYIFGFFFFLDIMSTVTLVLDITFVAEAAFGDAISHAENGANSQGSSGGGGDDDSTEAARAARMSRAGTKAGRVVRLIRLMRLIRLIKVFKKEKGLQVESPGDDWDDDDRSVEKESAVSKKLSEMTTRRVIMLVLSIMLTLPFFQADMYKDKLPNAAQYAADTIHRRFHDDVKKYNLSSGHPKTEEYYDSLDRENYVEDFLMFIYYHNWYCSVQDIPDDKSGSPNSNFGKLFWIGGSPPSVPETAFFMPGRNGSLLAQENLNEINQRYNGSDWNYYQCNLPEEVLSMLSQPWSEAQVCLSGQIAGFSLIESHEPDIKCPSDLRFQERLLVRPSVVAKDELNRFSFMFVFDRRQGSKMEAALNAGQTIFICLLLGVGAMTFSKDANTLVLAPIERMISKLEKIRKNPIAAMSIGEEEMHKEQMAAFRRHRTERNDSDSWDDVMAAHSSMEEWEQTDRSCWLKRICRNCYKRICDVGCCKKRESSSTPEPMETVVLEKTIIKIGSLLALGFGEAGAEIIGQNMKGSDSTALNAMIPGRRVEAVFGFCDINNFTEATEVLEDQVMVFVNRIADVVHSCIHEYFGSPNQNVGDAFLVVWRLSGHDSSRRKRLADMSVISFIKIFAKVNKSPLLAEYRRHPRMLKRLPNYRVNMGFGLHSGWAIEGAIGTEFKIDASYLSPNVNITSKLSRVTQYYGTTMIISDVLIKLLSERIAEQPRLIDNVLMVGSDAPLKLYTFDLDESALEVEEGSKKAQSKGAKFRHRYESQKKRQERWSEDFNMETFYEADPDIQRMRESYPEEFLCLFNMAYLNYEAGNWSIAHDMLMHTKTYLGDEDDGPSAALLRYMDSFDGQAPKTWKGYRVHSDSH